MKNRNNCRFHGWGQMKSKLSFEEIERYGYDAAVSKFYELTSVIKHINCVALNQKTIDILHDAEFLIKVKSSTRFPLVGLFESHSRQRMEKDIMGRIPMLCGYQIRIDDALNDLEIEIVEYGKGDSSERKIYEN